MLKINLQYLTPESEFGIKWKKLKRKVSGA